MSCTTLLSCIDCPPAWNRHLVRVNKYLQMRNVPLIVDENDRKNKDVCASELRERSSTGFLTRMFLGNGVLNVDLVKEKHELLLIQSFGQDAVFSTEKSITFVSQDLYFEIDKGVVFAEHSMKLNEGMNILAQTIRP